MSAFSCIGFLGIVMECTMPDPSKVTTIVCPPLVEWPVTLQQKAAAELSALPKDAALRSLAARAIEQRDLNKKCFESAKKNAPKK